MFDGYVGIQFVFSELIISNVLLNSRSSGWTHELSTDPISWSILLNVCKFVGGGGGKLQPKIWFLGLYNGGRF